MAQPACAEEYDSDRSEVRPGTTQFARSNASRRQPSSSRGRERSQTTVPAILPPAMSRRSSTPAATQAPPLQRTQSQTRRVQVHAPPLSRSNSISRQPTMCADPNCGQPGCTSRAQQPMYSRPPPNAMPLPQSVPVTYTPVMQPGYAQPRPRPQSMSARPGSWYGPPVTSQGYQPHGPPPSPSAYTRAPPRQAVYASQPTGPPIMASYGPPSFAQPPTPIDTMMAGMAITRPSSSYSARTLPSEYTMSVKPASRAQPQPLMRTTSLSARRPTVTRTIPGSFPDELAIEDDYAEYDYIKEIREPVSKRDSKLMAPPPRPIIRPVQTTPNFSARSVQDPSPRTSASDTGVDFLDYHSIDPDRTPRPPKDRRYSSSSFSHVPRADNERNPRSTTRYSHAYSSSRSRRQSASTASSSERTKSTNLSSAPSDQLADAMAYQKRMRGQQPEELTAENIREMDLQRTRSRASGRSHKSGHSASNPDGLRVMLGDSVIDLAGDANISYRAEAPGKARQVVITEGGPRSTAESRSTSSRVGRSRGTSERGSISREQPIFEGRET